MIDFWILWDLFLIIANLYFGWDAMNCLQKDMGDPKWMRTRIVLHFILSGLLTGAVLTKVIL